VKVRNSERVCDRWKPAVSWWVPCCRNPAARDAQVVVCVCVSGDGRPNIIED